jgi:hypothetical protein
MSDHPVCYPATECCEEDWPEPLSGTSLRVPGVDPVVVGDQAIAPPRVALVTLPVGVSRQNGG